jgi:hypothetical protein
MPSLKPSVLKTLRNYGAIGLLILCISCADDKNAFNFPAVSTDGAKATPEGVALRGSIRYFTGEILEKGFAWGIGTHVTIEDSHLAVAGADKEFTAKINTGLKAGTTYSARAYAKYDRYTIYGDLIQFEVSNDSPPPLLEDFNPKFGRIGSEITVTGKNFGYAGTETRVFVGGAEMIVKSSTDTEVVFNIPAVGKSITSTIDLDLNGTQLSSSETLEIYFPWKKLADFGLTAPSAYFSDESFLYVLRNNESQLTIFDPGTLAWKTPIATPVPATSSTLATCSNTNAYFLFDSKVYRLNIATKEWAEIATYAQARTSSDYIFVVNNSLYIGSLTGKLHLLNLTTGVWSEKKGLVDSRYVSSYSRSGRVAQGKAFISVSTDLLSYDPDMDVWSNHGKLGGLKGSCLFIIGTKVFMGLGEVNTGPSALVNLYGHDVVTGSIAEYVNAPVPLSVVVSFTVNQKGYMFSQQKLWEFDPTRN